MSRFFGAGGDSASDSEDSYQENPTKIVENKFYESSSDDEEKREVRTEKDKRYGELKNTITNMKKSMKAGDWNKVSDDFQKFNKQIAKAKNVFKKEGGIPAFVSIHYAYLRKNVDEAKTRHKKGETKMSRTNSKSLNQLGQRVRKEIRVYEKEIQRLESEGLLNLEEAKEEKDPDSDFDDPLGGGGDFAQEPEGEGEGEEGEGEGKFDDEGEGEGARDKEEFSDWSEDGEGEGESSGSDVGEMSSKGITRDFWVKKDTIKSEKKVRERKDRPRTVKEKKEKKEEKTELSASAVIKRLKDIEDMRGRRGDKRAYVESLKMLLTKAKKEPTRLKIQTLLATAFFDITLSTGKAMPVKLWMECAEIVGGVMDTLNKDDMLKLSEDDDVDENYELRELEDEEKEKKEKKSAEAAKKDTSNEIIYVRGNLFSFLSRLSSHFSQSLHEVDEHDASYVSRLKDETKLVVLIARCEKYYEQLGKVDFIIKSKLLHLSHTYYSYKPEFDMFKKKAVGSGYLMKPTSIFSEEKSKVYDLVIYLYQAEGARSKTIALLSHVYHYCIHNRFMEARNLLLMSHLQDVIHNADIDSRILYNRTLAQLGLCAFRNGHYGAALDCLSELHAYPQRIKELLAQGVTSQRYHERNLEKEKLERMREYPYHMHMNLDMLEAVNLISAMFAEIPNLAKHGKRKVISRSFRKQYDLFKKQAFTGPPESTRQLIMGASEALAGGDWEKCYKYISNLRMWNLMPHKEEVQARLQKQIQQSSLQIYLLIYGPQYCSIDVKQLCTMFSMTPAAINKVASRMMLRGELLGAWDQPSGCIVMHNEEVSRLQGTAMLFAEKVSQYVEMNERLLDLRNYYKTSDYQRNKEQKGGENRRSNYSNKKSYSWKGQMSRTSRY